MTGCRTGQEVCRELAKGAQGQRDQGRGGKAQEGPVGRGSGRRGRLITEEKPSSERVYCIACAFLLLHLVVCAQPKRPLCQKTTASVLYGVGLIRPPSSCQGSFRQTRTQWAEHWTRGAGRRPVLKRGRGWPLCPKPCVRGTRSCPCEGKRCSPCQPARHATKRKMTDRMSRTSSRSCSIWPWSPETSSATLTMRSSYTHFGEGVPSLRV